MDERRRLVKVQLKLTMFVEAANVPQAFDDALRLVELPDCHVHGTATEVERHSGYRLEGRTNSSLQPFKWEGPGKRNRSDKTCYQLVEAERVARAAKRKAGGK